MGAADVILEFLKKHPFLTVPAMGAGVGGVTGGVFSEEGAEGRGAAQGALLGAGLGGLGAAAGRVLHSVVPSPEHSLLAGGLAGGAIGGLFGQRRLGPLSVKRMERQEEERRTKRDSKSQEDNKDKRDKEASMSATPQVAREALKKEGEDNEVLEARVKAFDFGIDTFCAREGIDKAEFAKAAGLKTSEELAPATIAWLTQQLQEAK
jgi:hypothetical protein